MYLIYQWCNGERVLVKDGVLSEHEAWEWVYAKDNYEEFEVRKENPWPD